MCIYVYVSCLLCYTHVYHNSGYREDHELHEGWSRRWEELERGEGVVKMMQIQCAQARNFKQIFKRQDFYFPGIYILIQNTSSIRLQSRTMNQSVPHSAKFLK